MISINIDALAATLVLLTQKALVLTPVKNKLNLYRLYKFKHRRTLHTYILFVFMKKAGYNMRNKRLGRMSKKKKRVLKEAQKAMMKPGKKKQSLPKQDTKLKVNSSEKVRKPALTEFIGQKNVLVKARAEKVDSEKTGNPEADSENTKSGERKPSSFDQTAQRSEGADLVPVVKPDSKYLLAKKKISKGELTREIKNQRHGVNDAKKVQPAKKKAGFGTWLRKYRIILIILALLLVAGGAGVTIYTVQKNNFEAYRAEQTTILEDAKTKMAELFQDEQQEIPVRAVTEEQIGEVESRLDEVTFEDYQAERDERRAKLDTLRGFIKVRGELDGKFEEGVLRSATTAEEIEELAQKLQDLPEGYRGVLQERFGEMQTQYTKIGELAAAVAGLFADESMTQVRGDIVRENYNAVMEQYNVLPQADVKEKWREKLEAVDKELGIREEEARRRAEEAWRKLQEARRIAAEEQRRREEEIAAAWHVLNVPYHSQNLQAIYNGCETASLLMGLQFKGYLPGMDLRTYAEMIPKSTDPFQGFTYSIWDLEPKHAAHWIAPAPLAQFGRDSSGADVVDITGVSLDQLDAEIAAGNPVIIYLTFNYVAPKEWVEGAPRNLHVMLLTGYNSITGAQIMTDPWTQANGATTWTLSKATVESIYNATGQRAVVIR